MAQSTSKFTYNVSILNQMIKLLPRPQSFAQLVSQNVQAIVKVFLED